MASGSILGSIPAIASNAPSLSGRVGETPTCMKSISSFLAADSRTVGQSPRSSIWTRGPSGPVDAARATQARRCLTQMRLSGSHHRDSLSSAGLTRRSALYRPQRSQGMSRRKPTLLQIENGPSDHRRCLVTSVPPNWRFDVQHVAELAEKVVRPLRLRTRRSDKRVALGSWRVDLQIGVRRRDFRDRHQ